MAEWLMGLDLALMALDRAVRAAFALVAVASAITAMTPTPRDDEWLGRAYRLVEILALNFGYARQRPPNRLGGRFRPD